jgi:hypothetical protein
MLSARAKRAAMGAIMSVNGGDALDVFETELINEEDE